MTQYREIIRLTGIRRSISGHETEIMDQCTCPYVRIFWRCRQNSRAG